MEGKEEGFEITMDFLQAGNFSSSEKGGKFGNLTGLGGGVMVEEGTSIPG